MIHYTVLFRANLNKMKHQLKLLLTIFSIFSCNSAYAHVTIQEILSVVFIFITAPYLLSAALIALVLFLSRKKKTFISAKYWASILIFTGNILFMSLVCFIFIIFWPTQYFYTLLLITGEITLAIAFWKLIRIYKKLKDISET